MTAKMQNEILNFLLERGNGAYSKLQLHFIRQGRGQAFRAAFEALIQAGKVAQDGDMVALIDPTPVEPDGADSAQ